MLYILEAQNIIHDQNSDMLIMGHLFVLTNENNAEMPILPLTSKTNFGKNVDQLNHGLQELPPELVNAYLSFKPKI